MLTQHEQYSYMSMWVLMAAPLFYSGDITRLDPFTLNVLCNAEVIAVDQDALGVEGRKNGRSKYGAARYSASGPWRRAHLTSESAGLSRCPVDSSPT